MLQFKEKSCTFAGFHGEVGVPGFRSSGVLGFWGSEFRGSGFRVPGSGFRVPGSGFRVPGSGFWVPGSGVPGSRVLGS